MKDKLEVLKNKWSDAVIIASRKKTKRVVRKTADRLKWDTLTNTVNFLMGVQIPTMLSQINAKETENQQLSANLSIALKELSSLRNSITTKAKSESETSLKTQATISALKNENVKLKTDLKMKIGLLKSYREKQLQFEDQWTKIADEMAQIHGVEQYVHSKWILLFRYLMHIFVISEAHR